MKKNIVICLALFVLALLLYFSRHIRFVLEGDERIIIKAPDEFYFFKDMHTEDYELEYVSGDDCNFVEQFSGYDYKTGIYHMYVDSEYFQDRSVYFSGSVLNYPFKPIVLINGEVAGKANISDNQYGGNEYFFSYYYFDNIYGFWMEDVLTEYLYEIKIVCSTKSDVLKIIFHEY